jgi:diacylglycerol kinase family enzyme
METPDKTVENNYVFGAVSNSTSVAGILTLPQEIVNMSDGKFEILLVKNPKTPIELNECIRALTSKDYSSEMLDFFSSDRIAITAQKDMDWTLDGELQKGSDTISVKNIKHAIKVIL